MEYKVGTLVFNDWRIVREIGSGASGRVWEIEKVAHDISTVSALKVVQVPQNPSMEKTLHNDGMDEMSITRFFQGVVNDLTEEIKIMIDMKGFPHIVNCEDYSVIKYPDQVKWDILIRMELLTPIQEYIQKNDLSEADALKLGRELLQTLKLFESRGIIHRDIKPDNIFVDNYGNFKIGDFGIARVCDKASADLSKKGTENYMAPEVFHGKEYDHTVDIYSLGLVLYKLLNNNRLPFYPESGAYSEWDMQQALIDRLGGKKKMPLPVSASPEFGRIITRMCAHSPEERYQRAEDVLADLEHITGSVKGILGTAAGTSDSVADGTGAGAGFNATRAMFDGMVIHDAGAVRKLNRTGITGNGSQNTSAPPADAKTGADKKEAGADRAQAKTQKSGSGRAAGEAKKTVTEESGGREGVKKKAVIQGITAAAIVFAILCYFLMNKTYSLTVTDGSGTGTYKGGQKVTAAARDVPGSTFTKWEVTGKLSLTDKEQTEKTVSFKMPRHEVSLKAVYTVNVHSAVVNGGTGTGEYGTGEEVAVAAEEPEAGKEFAGWEVEDGSVSLEHADRQKTSFVMPDEDVEVSATYKNISYSLEVEDGEGSGSYDYGQTVRLVAQEKSGQTFKEWVILDGELALSDEEKTMPELILQMPACNLMLQAKYETNYTDDKSESESNEYEDQNIEILNSPVAPTMVLNPDGTMTYDQHVYMLYDRNDFGIRSYAEMKEFCENQGAHLAVISSAGENEAIYRYVVICGLTMAYFGYSDEDAEGVWEWATYEDNSYTNWAAGQPNNGANNKNGEAENYAHFSSDGDGTWNDAPFGSNTSHFVCEWD